ncbi:MAG: CusA/CzcA family heavy metal efflux RND transporter [Hydrogenovibrio sp.]|uniref:efflux RND transporter permease subunit n=1 Tax=Hydrogenovibrio TaxID=28884 RepID=UPI0003802479|nr:MULTISPECIES: CusA/CzcA family heavy metal efflux RND transporter [Hydrogenovibrio]MDR9498448.1 CusA/CzcA family heavy metal efflux RND transporter [Hydrogenovibrio sp.]
MITEIIGWSLRQRGLVLLLALTLGLAGWFSWERTGVDAIPDLSDVQVIVKTAYPGQSPQVVENQVTYPLSSQLMAVPKAKTVRGYSFYGDSYVYVLFEEDTDLYWARSRVLEYLNQAADDLPEDAVPALGPDASGVGWVYQYALVDKSGEQDLASLRSLQDWFLKFELQSVSGVAEVASIGGMVRQYQVTVDPNALRAHNLPVAQVAQAIREASVEKGASVVELGQAEYMVALKGYVDKLGDLSEVAVGVRSDQTPVLLKDIAKIEFVPAPRRGLAELNGEGEVVGGIVVMRAGANAMAVIESVKQKLATLKDSLPEGVEIVETYDRTGLIQRTLNTLTDKLWQEMLVVLGVSLLFLWHLRSALVALVALPLGILGAFAVLYQMGVNANIMTLGGIAIAIGTMVDAAIVMIENAHKHLLAFQNKHGRVAEGAEHWQLVQKATQQVGAPIFVSLLVIALSFLPVFALQEQAGRLFSPLALTKTWAMAMAAGLAITLVPVLIGYLIRGRLKSETENPVNRYLIAMYRPVLRLCLSWPKSVLVLTLVLMVSLLYPWQKLGTEFMPKLEEGDLLYMPTTLPGLSIGAAQDLLQQTDAMIKAFPEVKTVFGKIGRADTATDPAPLTMIETTISLKPKDEWREGMTLEKLISELDAAVDVPGVSNAWVQPIKTRIDMLSTGIKTPVGIKIAGSDLGVIQDIGGQLESALSEIEGVRSVFSERSQGGRYLDVIPDRVAAARYGLSMRQLSEMLATAVGGQALTETIEGRERYAMTMRFPQSWRDSKQALETLPIVTPSGAHIQLGMIADIRIRTGPAMIKSENAQLTGWTFVDLSPDVGLAGFVEMARKQVAEAVDLPQGYSLTWSGQFEQWQQAKADLTWMVPLVVLVIFVLLALVFQSMREAVMILSVIPVALLGAVWFVWWLDYDFSVAVAVGLIALAGVAAEFGVVMMLYLKDAIKEAQAEGRLTSQSELQAAIMQGAVQRVRPKAMTVSVIVVGLSPIMFGGGAGSEVMQRIAAPMIGGMISAPVVSMILLPVLSLWAYRSWPQAHNDDNKEKVDATVS